jgi:hypothetical protein
MNQNARIIICLIITSLLLTSCNFLGENNLNSQSSQQTEIANTVVALQTVLAADLLPTGTPLPASVTQEVQPTLTAVDQLQPTVEVSASPTATSEPAYLITNVEDITAVDNSVYAPGASFSKTWRLTNGGTATWSADTKLVYISGDLMGAAAVTLDRTVAPDQTVDVSVNLAAPTTEGTYQGNFMLQTSSGKTFGIGVSANNAFWVKIVVKKFFQVTDAVVNVSPASYTGTCPGSVSLSATISASAAGSVSYYFVTSTGNSNTYSMTFTAAGSLTSPTISWSIPGPDPMEVHIYVDSPNHQDFPSVTIPVTCN